jgi:pimeloyl-ACP methyl ester carboxylesterase
MHLATITGVTLIGVMTAACSDRDTNGHAADAGTADAIPADVGGQAPDIHELQPLLWEACDTSDWPVAEGYKTPSSAVQCTRIEVPLDHGSPGGKTFSLRVARQRGGDGKRALFYLAGGPGGTSVGTSGVLPEMVPEIEKGFDLVYVDQRGSGGSDRLECSKGYPRTEQEWSVCGAEHGGKPLGRYLTTTAAHDLDVVRARLGYDKIHLLGVSYGTTVALEYIRQHGSRVEAAVLDGLAPPEVDLMGESSRRLDGAIERLVKDCNADPKCTSICPDLASDLSSRREALKATPHRILVDGTAFMEDEVGFIIVLDALLHYVQTRFYIPRAVHWAVAGDNTHWNKLMSVVVGGTVVDDPSAPSPPRPAPPVAPRPLRPRRPPVIGASYVSPGLYMTIACGEWLPRSGGLAKLEAIMDAQDWPIDDYVLLAGACSSWKVNPVDAAFYQPVVAGTRTLLLSGELDMNTPPEWGTLAAKGLAEATHIILPNLAHATVNNSCAAGIAGAFLAADGRIDAVDTSCTKSISAPAW